MITVSPAGGWPSPGTGLGDLSLGAGCPAAKAKQEGLETLLLNHKVLFFALEFLGRHRSVLLGDAIVASLAIGPVLGIQQGHLLLLCHPRFVFIIGANNALHEMMAHHIAFVKVNEA